MSTGWIGVDFDGTLAHYEKWGGPAELGEPIWPMVERVKVWLAEGRDVRIFTARASVPEDAEDKVARTLEVIEARTAIRRWCLKYIGRELLITNVKDLNMIELYDDRAVQVEMNTGRLIGHSTRGLA